MKREVISIYYKSGILFASLENTPYHELKNIITIAGIKYLVLKLESLCINDYEKICFVTYNYNLIMQNNGKFILCGNVARELSHKLFYLDIVSVKDDVTALNLLER